MKAYWGSGYLEPHFLDLGTSWRWVVSFTPLPLYPQGNSPQYPLDRRLGRPRSRSGQHGEEKILDPTRIQTPIHRSFSLLPVAIPAMLSRLLNTTECKQIFSGKLIFPICAMCHANSYLVAVNAVYLNTVVAAFTIFLEQYKNFHILPAPGKF
jgi:hypothetical protein